MKFALNILFCSLSSQNGKIYTKCVYVYVYVYVFVFVSVVG